MSHKCPKCGAEVVDQLKFCPECGTAQKTRKKEPQPTAENSQQQLKKSPGKNSSQNILYLVALLSLMVVALYGYRFLSPVSKPDPHANLPAAGTPNQNRLFDQEQYQHLQENLKINPDGFQENVDMANFLFDNQRFSDAIDFYLKATQINPNQPDILVDTGVSYFNLKKFSDARTYFDKAIKINANHVNALYNMGVVSAQLGDMPQMLEYWERLIKVAPETEQARAAKQMMDQVKGNEP
jgi:cytochrome c-type biogenesis protein CcmH/NrfG